MGKDEVNFSEVSEIHWVDSSEGKEGEDVMSLKDCMEKCCEEDKGCDESGNCPCGKNSVVTSGPQEFEKMVDSSEEVTEDKLSDLVREVIGRVLREETDESESMFSYESEDDSGSEEDSILSDEEEEMNMGDMYNKNLLRRMVYSLTVSQRKLVDLVTKIESL